MDSVSQFVLGGAIGVAVMGRRTAPWKAILWGGIAGTIPDLDSFINYGDAVSNMVRHRAESHSVFFLTLLAPLLAFAPARLHPENALNPSRGLYQRWLIAMWLALITHPLLDWFTIYGTQLFRPFSTEALGLGSMFIIDPLYTLPLIAGLIVALDSKRYGLKANGIALTFSCVYLAWSAIAQQHALGVAREQLAAQMLSKNAQDIPLFATPAPLNTLLWRVVYLTDDSVHEGYYSLFDNKRQITFERFPRGQALVKELASNLDVQRMTIFADGFVKLTERNGKAILSDLRMGQEPNYAFNFELAERDRNRNDNAWRAIPSVNIGSRVEVGRTLSWLWKRMWGQYLPPPR